MDATLLGAGDDQGDAEKQDLKLALADRKFLLRLESITQGEKAELMSQCEDAIFKNEMAPTYEHFCSHLGWKPNEVQLDRMKAANAAKLEDLDAKIADSEANMGDDEVREAMMARADYLVNIGARDKAWEAYAAVEKKTPSVNHKLVIIFSKVRLEIMLGNWKHVKDLLAEAKHMCEKGGDWEKKNRLTVYDAMYCLAQRQFQRAATLLLDALATFSATELFSYQQCIFYAVIAAVITLPRPELKKQVAEASEVLTVIHKLPGPQQLLFSLYDCNYKTFFPGFSTTVEALERDMLLAPHVRHFMREARIVAYRQYLASYKSVTLSAMASAFGITADFLDNEVSNFIVSQRIAAKIDRVAGTVEATVLDKRHANYQALLKEGDLLLNRIQKLSKIVDVE